MKRTTLMLCMGLSTLVLAATQVKAQNRQCGPRETVVNHLAENFSETRQMIGLTGNNAMLEIYAAESGSWTVLVTNPEGMTCLVASGEHFQLRVEALPNTDQGA